MIWLRRCALAVAALAVPSFAIAGDLLAGPNLGVIDTTGTYDPPAAQEYSGGGILDEVRLGGFLSVQGSSPDGPLIGGQVLFDPFVGPYQNYFLNTLLRPRIHIGGLVATDNGTDQLFAGFTWNFPIGDTFFLEAALGGTVHDGGTDDEGLGCSFAFRESAGAGLNIGRRWRAIASIDHSSNANLCDGNGGLTHAGVSVGYRF